MSSTLTCTRAVAPRFISKSIRCRRNASTEATTIESTSPSAPVGSSQQLKEIPEPLHVKMHRRLYPELYEKKDAKNWVPVADVVRTRPRQVRIKPVNAKWEAVMKQQGIHAHMSQQFGVPVFKPAVKPIKKTCPDPVATVAASQIAVLDPTGARTRLFAKDNPECARVGDILLVRQRTGDPFAGVCINIRRRGADTAILLRGQLTRVGVEMWYKIYSPLVEGIEVVQRAAKRARRARLTYMRKVKHDRGSVENVVRMYLRQKAALGTAEGQKKGGAAKAAAMGGKKTKGRGKKR